MFNLIHTVLNADGAVFIRHWFLHRSLSLVTQFRMHFNRAAITKKAVDNNDLYAHGLKRILFVKMFVKNRL